MYIIYERSKKEHGNPANGEYGQCLVIDQLIFQNHSDSDGVTGQTFHLESPFSASVQIIFSKTW